MDTQSIDTKPIRQKSTGAATILRCLMPLLACCLCLIPLANSATAQQNKGLTVFPLTPEERIELAKALMKKTREQAMTNPNSQVANVYTQWSVAIEPRVVAKFILANPIKTNLQRGNDWKAISYLAKHPTSIPEAQLLELLRANSGSPQHALTVAKSLSVSVSLRQKVIEQTLDNLPSEFFYPHWFAQLTELAALSSNPKHRDLVADGVASFYADGAADKFWEQIQAASANPNSSPSNLFSAVKLLRRFAPGEQKEKYKLSHDQPDPMLETNQFAFLSDDSLNRETKIEKLHGLKLEKFPYRLNNQPQLTSITPLGAIAQLDVELAKKWVDSIDYAPAHYWATLLIAPALFKTDPDNAKRMIEECYTQFPSMIGNRKWNTPDIGPELCAMGLPIVENVAPELLDDCIRLTVEAAESYRESASSNNRHDLLFKCIVSVARYDRPKAQTLFDKYSSDIELESAQHFFKALLVLRPQDVLQEIEDMPASGANGVDYRVYLPNALLPALRERNDEKAWLKLLEGYTLKLDPTILGVK